MCLLTCMPILKQYTLCWDLLLIIFITITIRHLLIRLHGLPAYVCPGLHLHTSMLGPAIFFRRMTGLLSLTMSAKICNRDKHANTNVMAQQIPKLILSACRRFFDLQHWKVVLVDQRGCGSSTPLGCLVDNNTQALIDDYEKLRKRLKIKKWMLFGGSWGVSLSLAYAQQHAAK